MQCFYSFIFIICILNSLECSLFDEVHFRITAEGGPQIDLFIAKPQVQLFFATHNIVDKKPPDHITVGNDQIYLEYPQSTYLIVSKWTDECIVVNYSTGRRMNFLDSTVGAFGQNKYGGSDDDGKQWPYKGMWTEDGVYQQIPDEGVMEPYWISQNGYYVYVHNASPLFMENYSSLFFLKTKYRIPYTVPERLSQNYVLCVEKDILQAQKHAIAHFFGKPSTIPDERLVTQVVWSTDSKFGKKVDQKEVFQFAQDIANHSLSGQLRIDGIWEECPGSLKPNENSLAFKNLTDDLRQLNFTVALTIRPLVGYKCADIYDEGIKNNYFVKTSASVPDSNSTVRVIDLTNRDALNWYLKRVQQLRDTYGINSFKLDDSAQPFVYRPMTEGHPELIAKESGKLLASLGLNVPRSVALNIQKDGFLVRMVPRTTSWDLLSKGLQSVIPTLLNMNIMGYSYVVPDKIGGNGQYNDILGSSELYIRWTQLNVFMPFMEFSIPPWDFDDPRVLPTVKKFLDLRAQYTSYIIDLMKEHVETGDPVNRPLWWMAPKEVEVFKFDDEFLLGDKILVAPILHNGQRKRDVYLPAGLWKDGNGDKTYNGSSWVREYPAALDVLPYFINMQSISRQTTVTAT